jgi:hypothetical protein
MKKSLAGHWECDKRERRRNGERERECVIQFTFFCADEATLSSQ